MAETDPVEIAVEIVANIEDDVAEIKSQLNSLRDDIVANFDLEDGGDIEQIRARLEAIQEHIEANVDLDVEDVTQSEAQIDAVARDRVARIQTMVTGRASGALSELQETFGRRMQGFRPTDLDKFEMGITGGSATPDNVIPRDIGRMRANLSGDDSDMLDAAGAVRKLNSRWNKLGRTLLKYKPSIMDWWNIMALLIPIMITLAGAAIGVAAAFVALAGAAATLVGVGLLGWGDDLQSTFQNLKEDAKALANELFGVMQPAAAEFRPILEDWIDAIPRAVQQLVDEIQTATQFADTLEAAGAGFMSWLEDAIQAMASLDEEIEAIVMRIGGGFGTFIIELLSAMVREVHKNMDAYMKLADIFVAFFAILFNLAKVVTFVVAQLGPLVEITKFIAGLLSNKIVVVLLTIVTTMFIWVGVMAKVTAAAITLAGLLQGRLAIAILFYMLQVDTAIAKTMAWIASLSALQKAILGVMGALALLGGVGLALMAGGAAMKSVNTGGGAGGGGGGSRRQAGGNTFININGDVGRKQMNRLIDRMPSEANREHNRITSMQR